MVEAGNKKTPRDYLRIVFRRWRLFSLSASLCAIGVMVGSHWVPLKYTGTTIMLRRLDAAAPEGPRDRESFKALQDTLVGQLRSFKATAQAVEDLGLTQGMPRGRDGQLTDEGAMAKQRLVQALGKDIKIDWDVRSNQLDRVLVSFTSANPELAQQMPDTLVKNYINEAAREIIAQLTQSRDFLLTQVGNSKKRLDELVANRIEFESKHAGMLPDSPGALQEQIQQILADVDTVRRQQAVAKQKLARLKGLVEGVKEEGEEPKAVQVVKGPNPELKRLEDQLRQYKDQLDAAVTINRMTDNHPTVQTLRKKVEQLEAQIKETPAEAVLQTVYGTVPVNTDLGMELAGAQSEVEMTTSELERLQTRLTALQSLQVNFGPIRQEYLRFLKAEQESQEELKRWQDRLTEVQMALAPEVAKRRTHLDIEQAALRQTRPSSPKLAMVLAAAILGGLGFGGGLVFVAYAFDRSISVTEDATRHFGIAVHGVIGEIETPRQQTARRLRRWIATPIAVGVIGAVLAVSCLSIVLFLEYPDKHKEWRSAPGEFIVREVGERSKELFGRL